MGEPGWHCEEAGQEKGRPSNSQRGVPVFGGFRVVLFCFVLVFLPGFSGSGFVLVGFWVLLFWFLFLFGFCCLFRVRVR